jgi:hypothetical protein
MKIYSATRSKLLDEGGLIQTIHDVYMVRLYV